MRRTIAAALVAALLAGACSGDDAATPTTVPGPTTTTIPDVGLSVTRAELVSDSSVRGSLTEPLRGEVVRVVEAFLQATSLTPMVTGSTPDGIDRLVTPEVGDLIGGRDRHLMVDEGLPSSQRVHVLRADVGLTGLGGAAEPVQLVVARLRLELRGVARGGSVVADVSRAGQLTVVPGDDGWRISEYVMAVERDVRGAAMAGTSTTASGGG